MDAADQNVANEKRVIADAEFDRTRRTAPDSQRRAAKKDVYTERHHEDHHDRSACEPAQRNPLYPHPEAEHGDGSHGDCHPERKPYVAS